MDEQQPLQLENADVKLVEQEQVPEKEPDQPQETEVEALSNNKVDVEIEPDVKSNRVALQLCSCSIVWNCFSNREPQETAK